MIHVDKVSIAVGKGSEAFDVFYSNRRFIMRKAGKDEDFACGTSVSQARKQARKLLLDQSPQSTEKIILMTCERPLVMEAEVVSREAKRRRVKLDGEEEWTRRGNPTYGMRHRLRDIYEMPFTESRLKKAELFHRVNREFDDVHFAYNSYRDFIWKKVKGRKRKDGITKISGARVDELDVAKATREYVKQFNAKVKVVMAKALKQNRRRS